MAEIIRRGLTRDREQRVSLPNGAQVLSVAVMQREMYLYALGTPSDSPVDTCVVRIYYGAGDAVAGIPPDPYTRLPEAERARFLGTCIIQDGWEGEESEYHIFYTMHRSVPVTVFGQAEPFYKPTTPPRGTCP